MNERTHYVYEAYDADGLLLYVGCTGHLRDRLQAHLRPSYCGLGWFGPFHDSWRVSGPYTKDDALRIESERIDRYQPIWNGQSVENAQGKRALIAAYLKFHGVKFAPHPRYMNSVVLVPMAGRRRASRRTLVLVQGGAA